MVAQRFFESLIPDEVTRTRALKMLADAIDIAHHVGGQWGVTVYADLLRLNVGGTEAFVLSRGNVRMLVDTARLPVRSETAWSLGDRPYPSAGGARLVEVALNRLDALVGISDAQRAASKSAHRRRYPHRRSHEPDVLTYLSRQLGREMPNPAWWSADAGQAEVVPGSRANAEEDSQGTGLSPQEKMAVERHAVQRAIEHFRAEGWQIDERGKPYDLHCTRGTEEVHVEVKGTITRGESVRLTFNEVQHARDQFPDVALFVLSSIQLIRGEVPTTSGGTVRLIAPWRPDEGSLTPLAYTYVLPTK